MTITKEQLTADDAFCLSVYENLKVRDLSGEALMAFNVGKEIHEKLNAKKKVDYSVLAKHGIDVTSACGRVIQKLKNGDIPLDCKPRTGYWFSAMNFEDVEQVMIDLTEAGFDVEGRSQSRLTREATYEDYTFAFKINGAAEGREL